MSEEDLFSEEKIKRIVYRVLEDFIRDEEKRILNIDCCPFDESINDGIIEKITEYAFHFAKHLTIEQDFIEDTRNRDDKIDFLIACIAKGFLVTVIQTMIALLPIVLKTMVREEDIKI